MRMISSIGMETEKSEKDTVVTQVSIGGFDIHVKAKDLVAYLENKIGLVWRCRLKTSWTPQESYPYFEASNTADFQRTERDTAFSLKDTTEYAVIRCDFKLEFLVRDINEVKQYTDWSTSSLGILLQLASAPSVWYRTADDDIEVSVPFDLLDDDDPWIRTTDFTPSGAIGRCNSYRVSVPPRHGAKLNRALSYLREQRVQVEFLKLPLKNLNEPEPLDVNLAALKHICSYKRPVFDAHKCLKAVQQWLLKNPKLFKSPKQLDDIVEIRRLAITPTRAYCLPPEVELSNRVLRKYKDIADRFLRVTFMDEGLQTINANTLTYYAAPIVKDITSNSFSQKTRVFKRVKGILTDGFYLCGRRYSFLAFSSNQLRDRSAWFFAENENISVHQIRNWMGRFTNKNIAKCAARMGQCFSSTYATVDVPLAEADLSLPDIERNGYTFSDGIGIITPDLAKEVAEKLKLDANPPCAYQIRYAGCKGVVACWPAQGDGIRLSLRPSMNKFLSNHTTLEICSWTRFQPGFLNRQIITLLSTLKVQDEIFWNMQIAMVSKLDQMLKDADVAFDVITSCTEQGNTAAIMLSAGFKPQKEPHLRGMLTCIRAAQLWGLREKARIFVPSGRWLMGCLDELGCLSKKGDRPHTNEASGSDLDGDLYFVTWDENLIPPSKKSWAPMQYDATEAKVLNRAVSYQDIIDFFARHMVNENLGAICNAHVVHADLSEFGALYENCIKLAELAATAVDFPKTGKLVTMPAHLKPKMYPDFMGKEDYQSYKSTKILGRLYRQIKDAYDDNVEAASSELIVVPGDIPYDRDLEVFGSSDYILDAWDQKCSYDGQLKGLLGQYKVRREEEVASAWYQVAYHPKWIKKSMELQEPDAAANAAMLSFAWIAADYLARIKIRCRGIEGVDTAKPVNSLVKYLADRI
ncbi:hypothetical protein GH714_022824 [Hevea brasiliensis]|uniref:RNA-dependent RNA polymerase n=1 Tax=Hevea brasiliensis TaxID=3981 RepID=A0A6A6KTV1_HEVBR|nr:hypothetical protein GH714_022824 [Hevea brasiliensis]